jgi:autotransporter-associated beta strand protein
MRVAPSFLLTLAATLSLTAAANAQILPGAIQQGTIRISLQTVANGLTAPIGATFAPGDTHDLFVVDQIGKIRIIHDGVLQSTPLLDISSIESAIPLNGAYDERGLLGLAFSPGFSDSTSSGYHTLYTYQSERAGTATADFGPAAGTASSIDHQNVLVQWKVSATNPNVVDTSTRKDLIREDHPAGNHNGGTVAFGPDGDLYLAIGDGGSSNDSGNGHIVSTGNAQALNVAMGKMLRIDPNGTNSANGKYGIPATNPFLGTTGAVKEIYAYGFRNPFKFSFDSANGHLIVADVGQNNVEEVDQVTSGGNYGWATKEGTFLFNRSTGNVTSNSPGSPPGLIDPLVEYDHTAGQAVIGGFVYHGALLPQLDGDYVFGDLSNGSANGRLFYSDLSTGQIKEFKLSPTFGKWLKGFGLDANGEIYVTAGSNEGPSGTVGVVQEIMPPSIWTGASGTIWNVAGNWTGVVPGATTGTTNTDTASFIQSETNSPLAIDSSRNVQNIVFTTANVSSMTIGTVGGPALLLTSGGSIQATSSVINPQTVNAPLVLEGNYTFTSDAASNLATLSFGGGITPGPTSGVTTLTLGGGNAGTNTISGVLADNGAGKLAVAKTGGALWILYGANTYTGDTTVSAGTLKFAITTGTPSVGAAATATVAAGATLELAGTVSALGKAGGNRAHVVNNSTAPGVVVSGTHQVVGAIDGLGNVQVNAGSDLTANHIVQTALVIGGASGNVGRVTIDPSDASGNSLNQSTENTLIDSPDPGTPFGSNSLGSSSPLAGDGSTSHLTSSSDNLDGSTAAVPEPGTLVLALLGLASITCLKRRR